eukprot:1593124-Pyramimonas_sp.AAC.1
MGSHRRSIRLAVLAGSSKTALEILMLRKFSAQQSALHNNASDLRDLMHKRLGSRAKELGGHGDLK